MVIINNSYHFICNHNYFNLAISKYFKEDMYFRDIINIKAINCMVNIVISVFIKDFISKYNVIIQKFDEDHYIIR